MKDQNQKSAKTYHVPYEPTYQHMDIDLLASKKYEI